MNWFKKIFVKKEAEERCVVCDGPLGSDHSPLAFLSTDENGEEVETRVAGICKRCADKLDTMYEMNTLEVDGGEEIYDEEEPRD